MSRVDPSLLDRLAFVSRRILDDDLRPAYVYRESSDGGRDSGWRAVLGDETPQEADDPATIRLEPLRVLLERWPELRPVLATDPLHGAWGWDEAQGRYVRLPEGS
jgi:hypothetical protein